MLVLRSKVGQSVYIGPNIRVKVVAVEGNSVRLGYDVPDDIRVQRSSLGSLRDPKQQPMLPERK